MSVNVSGPEPERSVLDAEATDELTPADPNLAAAPEDTNPEDHIGEIATGTDVDDVTAYGTALDAERDGQ